MIRPRPNQLMVARGWTTHEKRRQEALRIYGGKCSKCDARDGLSVVPIGRTWSDVLESGPAGGYSRYLWLAQHAFPAGFELRCPNHASGYNAMSQHLHEMAVLARQEARQQIIEHYGYHCYKCGKQDDLKLEPIPVSSWVKTLGTARTTNRYQRIVRAGFPEGIRLMCKPSCAEYENLYEVTTSVTG